MLRLGALLLLVLSPCLCQHPSGSAYHNAEEKRAAEFIARAESELLASTEKQTFVEWAYASNITDHNEREKLAYQVGKRCVFLPETVLRITYTISIVFFSNKVCVVNRSGVHLYNVAK